MAPTHFRRPSNYWDTFNAWAREHMETGKRPGVQAITEWWTENAERLWPDPAERPTLDEAMRHGKGLRSIAVIKEYFRDYRRRRVDAGDPVGAWRRTKARRKSPSDDRSLEEPGTGHAASKARPQRLPRKPSRFLLPGKVADDDSGSDSDDSDMLQGLREGGVAQSRRTVGLAPSSTATYYDRAAVPIVGGHLHWLPPSLSAQQQPAASTGRTAGGGDPGAAGPGKLGSEGNMTGLKGVAGTRSGPASTALANSSAALTSGVPLAVLNTLLVVAAHRRNQGAQPPLPAGPGIAVGGEEQMPLNPGLLQYQQLLLMQHAQRGGFAHPAVAGSAAAAAGGGHVPAAGLGFGSVTTGRIQCPAVRFGSAADVPLESLGILITRDPGAPGLPGRMSKTEPANSTPRNPGSVAPGSAAASEGEPPSEQPEKLSPRSDITAEVPTPGGLRPAAVLDRSVPGDVDGAADLDPQPCSSPHLKEGNAGELELRQVCEDAITGADASDVHNVESSTLPLLRQALAPIANTSSAEQRQSQLCIDSMPTSSARPSAAAGPRRIPAPADKAVPAAMDDGALKAHTDHQRSSERKRRRRNHAGSFATKGAVATLAAAVKSWPPGARRGRRLKPYDMGQAETSDEMGDASEVSDAEGLETTPGHRSIVTPGPARCQGDFIATDGAESPPDLQGGHCAGLGSTFRFALGVDRFGGLTGLTPRSLSRGPQHGRPSGDWLGALGPGGSMPMFGYLGAEEQAAVDAQHDDSLFNGSAGSSQKPLAPALTPGLAALKHAPSVLPLPNLAPARLPFAAGAPAQALLPPQVHGSRPVPVPQQPQRIPAGSSTVPPPSVPDDLQQAMQQAMHLATLLHAQAAATAARYPAPYGLSPPQPDGIQRGMGFLAGA